MANYKEIITGTLNNVIGKVKEAAENSDTLNNVVDKVKDVAENNPTINNVVGKVKEAAENSNVKGIYSKGTSRAKAYAQIAKLTLEMNGENEELKKVFCEIGRLYYEQAKDAPEGYFAPLFEQAETVSASIEAKQAEIEELKVAAAEDNRDIEVEIENFEDTVDGEIVDFEAVVAAAEKAADTVKEVVDDVAADIEVEITEEPEDKE